MTRKFLLIAGVASLALAAPAAGERGGKNRDDADQTSQSSGQAKAQRPERAERAQRAERPQRVERQRIERAERPQRVERQRIERAEPPQRFEHQRVQRAERPQRAERQRFERQRMERAERPQRIERQRLQRAERPQRVERQRFERAERPQRIERQRIERAERPQRIERQRIQRAERPRRVERQRVLQAERRSIEQFDRRQALVRNADVTFDRLTARAERRARLANVSRNQLTARSSERPMRQMEFRDDQRIIAVGDRVDPAQFSSFVPTFYRTRYYDTPDYFYRYDDDLGYLYRIDRDDDLVRALIPLFGGYGIGDPWPRTYYSSYVPLGYQSYYYDTPDHYYRYDGYGIYQIDAQTQLITALVALLTGQGFGVGQMLPASYGAYNVPLAYRSTYYDRDDAWYRYGDGFIYQVDPYSRRIAARYPLYGNEFDYLIGEPWPAAYPGYNVPFGYQSLYYDTPDYHYRYANGGIYQVDPTTQIIQALVALVSGQPFGIGQALPAGYGAYNVPLAYRDRYYDTDDAWYRYADGYVYQVDPFTGLIEESIPIYA